MNTKNVFSIVLALMLSSQLFAQDLDIGIKVGANYANLNSDLSAVDYKSIPGLHAGIFASISATDKFELQPEILYSIQGSDREDAGVTSEARSAYVNVPVIAKIFIIKKLNLQVGPQFGLLLSANSTTAGVEQDIKDQFKSSSFDIVVGAGYDLFDKLDLSLRYVIGVSDINDIDGVAAAAGAVEEIKNSVLQLSIGLALN